MEIWVEKGNKQGTQYITCSVNINNPLWEQRMIPMFDVRGTPNPRVCAYHVMHLSSSYYIQNSFCLYRYEATAS